MTRTARATHRGDRRLAFLASLGLIASLLTIQALPARANHPEASLAGSDFEIDVNANLKVDDPAPPSLDWANVSESRRNDQLTGQNDDSFRGGAKEDDACPGTTTGSIPNNKSDLLTFGVYEEPGDPGFLHLFWTRVQEPSGTTLMDFELNQSATSCGNGVNNVRTTGDLLIEYRLEQGGATAQILIREWEGTAWGPEQDLTAIGVATGTINSTAIPASEADGLGSLSPRTFGEASLDLSFIFDEADCLSFGSAFLKSRSSTSFTSQLKDYISPVPVQISNCGTITVLKETVPDGAAGSFGFTTTGGLSPATFDLADDGSQVYTDVLAGSYMVSEDDDAPGVLDSIVCTGGSTSTSGRTASITLAADDDVVCTFTNLLEGSILVHKVDESDEPLAGAGFTITPGDITMTELSTGVFCTDDLAFGDHTITETTVPAGYDGADPQDFTVGSTRTCAEKVDDGDAPDLVFTNSPAPGTINIAKTDDDAAPLQGAEFTLYADDGDGAFEGGGDDGVVATCTTDATGACSFTDVDPGDYWIDETSVPSGYTKDPTLPVAVTIGVGDTAGEGQTVNLSFEDPQTHKVIVIVCHEGTATLAASDVDGNLTTIGTAPAFATEAELCSLDGFTGLPHGPQDYTVDVGSDAHQ